MNNIHWSLRDYDPKCVTNGVGGQQNIFRMAQNLYTNDPEMYKESSYNRTMRDSKPGKQMSGTFYHYYNNEGVKDLNLMDRQKTYSVGRYINKGTHSQYSNRLHNKGTSNFAFT